MNKPFIYMLTSLGITFSLWSQLAFCMNKCIKEEIWHPKISYPWIPGNTNKEKKEYLSEPLKELVETSDIIVIGKIATDNFSKYSMGNVAIGKGAIAINKSTLSVHQLIKGNNTRKIVLYMPPSFAIDPDKSNHWFAPIFACGINGIWFLTKKSQKAPKKVIESAANIPEAYFIDYSYRFVPLGKETDKMLLKIYKMTTLETQDKPAK